MTNRYLVTGGAGFIGSHVVDWILRRGDAVTVLDDFSTGSQSNLDAVDAGADGRLTIVRGSITDSDTVGRAADGARGVIHLAALPSVVRSVEAPLDSHAANVTGTVTVLDEARRRGMRVVYAGSSSAYGDQGAQFKREDMRESPLSPYAASKLAGELYCRSFARVYDVPIVVTRFFNVFGPRQVPDSPYSGVVAAFCFAMLRGQSPRIDGDGLQSRDFTYVEDVARGVMLAMDADSTGCETVNLACGGNATINELFEILRDYAGVVVEPEYAPPRAGDVRSSQADIARVRDRFGFEPGVSFDEGLHRTFDWYRSTYGS